MTEYDCSPEAIDQYMQNQARIQNWTSANALSQQCDPEAPPTPAVRSRSLSRTRKAHKILNESSPPAATETQAAWAHKKHDAMAKMYPSGASGPPSLTVRTPAAAPNQVYNYTHQTNRYGSQLNISTQTSDGLYVQQQSYQQTTRPLQLAPQTLQVPPTNYAPLAQNPYPAPEHFRLPGASAAPTHRVRSKSSHSARKTPSVAQLGGGIYAPTVPPIPAFDRTRSHSNVRPSGAAAPLQPSNGAYANGIYGGPLPQSFQSSVSSLQLPTASSQNYPLFGRETRKSKSSATLHSKFAQQAQHPRVEDMPPIPAPQQAQLGFYTVPRGSKSSATLHAEPRGHSTRSRRGAIPPMLEAQMGGFYTVPRASKSSATLYAEPHGASTRSRSHRDASSPQFGEKMSSPHPAASQMLVHSLIPLATYKDQEQTLPTRAKPQPLLKRLFGKKTTN